MRKKEKVDPARLLAWRVLEEVNQSGAFSNESLNRFFTYSDLSKQSKQFATALVYETLSRQEGLDLVLEKYCKRPIESLEHEVLNVLRLGLWQLLYSFSVPESAAVDESVKLCRYLGKESATSLVNAVLRSVNREEQSFNRKELGPSFGLSKELFGMFRKWYGEEHACSIAEAFLQRDYTLSLRPNRKIYTGEELRAALQKEGCTVEEGTWLKETTKLLKMPGRLEDLSLFNKGAFSIQDEAAQFCGHISKAENCLTILDLCAAPGGKTFDFEERAPKEANVLGLDFSEDRLFTARENAERLGHSSRFLQADACDLTEVMKVLKAESMPLEGVDFVLADVPCSGLGLLGRKPEIRQRMNYEAIQVFPPLQKQILETAFACVRAGGRVMYSTCTLNPEENEEQVHALLERHPGKLRSLDIRTSLPEALLQRLEADENSKKLLDEGMLLLRPDLTETDGFFIAVLEKY